MGFAHIKLLFNLLLIILFPLNCIPQGLFFRGIGAELQERSSFSVFANKNCVFADYFEINFKISLYDIESFGCIFLLKDKKSEVEYNLMHMRESENYNLFKFNIGSKGNLLVMRVDSKRLDQRRWVDLSARFDLSADSVCITIDGQTFSKKNLNLPKRFAPDLTFGFITDYVELPSFGLRSLKVGNKKLCYKFPLNESEGNDVHDSSGNIIGMISGPPIWLINSAYHWNLRFNSDSLSLHGINYQPSTQNMLFFFQDSIQVHNMLSDSSAFHKYANAVPLTIWMGVSFLDERSNRLYVYEVHDCKNCKGAMSSLDLRHFQWTPECNDLLPMQLHHHSGYLDAKRNQYIVFGGFGNRMYNRHFFTYDLLAQKWDTLHYTGDRITPRYFQGMAASGNSLYIFGGMGNDSGDQEIGRRNYYDLHKLDLEKRECSKLWEVDWEGMNMISARNTIVIGDSLLYALCYPEYESNTYAQLYKFSIKDGTYEILGDSIHFRSDEILTNINLFYNDILQEFYCVVQEVAKNNRTNSRIYSLAYPGIPVKDLFIYKKPGSGLHFWHLILLAGCLIIIISTGLFFRRKHSNKDGKVNIKYSVKKQIDTHNQEQRKENGVYLFGGFTLYDRTGKDITYMFSTRLKNTFLLILQYSLTEGGITSHQLSNILWFDKDEYSAKNLRGVTINKLRKILAELDGLKLVFDKGFYSLIVDDEFFCDCKSILEMIEKDMKNLDEFHEINNILSRGIFLKSMNEPVLESFVLFMKERLTTNLPIYIEEVFRLNDYLLVIRLTDHLLPIDPLNLTVISFQLRSLYCLNQESEAKKRYTLFSLNYNKLTNKELQSLTELLNLTK